MSKYVLGKGRIYFGDSPLTGAIKELKAAGEFREYKLQNAVIETVFKATIDLKTSGGDKRKWLRFSRAAYREQRNGMGPVKPRKSPGASRPYIGPVKALQGKRAILVDRGKKGVLAQFNEFDTGKGYGWWPFSRNSFGEN